MTEYEMVEKLAARMGVTLEEARAALEQCQWDMLDAALLIERTQGEAPREYTTRSEDGPEPEAAPEEGGWRAVLGRVGRGIATLVRWGSTNAFVISRDGEKVMELPVIALALLLIFAFWVCVPLLIIGLFTRFRYAFSGPELGREDVNRMLEKAAEGAERAREKVLEKRGQ